MHSTHRGNRCYHIIHISVLTSRVHMTYDTKYTYINLHVRRIIDCLFYDAIPFKKKL